MNKERSVTALPTKPFAATGRGRKLAQLVNSPLKSKEFEKRKKLQELILSGQLPTLSEQYYVPNKHNKPTAPTPCNRITEKRCGEDSHDNTVGYSHVREEKLSENLTSKKQFQDLERVKPQSLNGLYNMKRNGKFIGNNRTQKALTKDCRPVAHEVSDISGINASKSFADSGKEADWDDWEKSVVIEASFSDEGLDELAIVDDNDDMNDVVVQQYIKALQEGDQPNDEIADIDRKITPTRVQKVSKLKSTTNADTLKSPPGTVPNPPKGMDRWGGSELKDVTVSTGWGDVNSNSLNCYNDGVSIWNTASPGSKDGNTPNASNTSKSFELQQSNSFQFRKTKQIGTAPVKSYNYSNNTVSDKQSGSKNNYYSKARPSRSSYSSVTSGKNTLTTTPFQRAEKHQKDKIDYNLNGVNTNQSNLNKSLVFSGDRAGSKANDTSGWDDCAKSNANDVSGWGDINDHSKNWYDDGSSLWDSSN